MSKSVTLYDKLYKVYKNAVVEEVANGSAFSFISARTLVLEWAKSTGIAWEDFEAIEAKVEHDFATDDWW